MGVQTLYVNLIFFSILCSLEAHTIRRTSVDNGREEYTNSHFIEYYGAQKSRQYGHNRHQNMNDNEAVNPIDDDDYDDLRNNIRLQILHQIRAMKIHNRIDSEDVDRPEMNHYKNGINHANRPRPFRVHSPNVHDIPYVENEWSRSKNRPTGGKMNVNSSLNQENEVIDSSVEWKPSRIDSNNINSGEIDINTLLKPEIRKISSNSRWMPMRSDSNSKNSGKIKTKTLLKPEDEEIISNNEENPERIDPNNIISGKVYINTLVPEREETFSNHNWEPIEIDLNNINSGKSNKNSKVIISNTEGKPLRKDSINIDDELRNIKLVIGHNWNSRGEADAETDSYARFKSYLYKLLVMLQNLRDRDKANQKEYLLWLLDTLKKSIMSNSDYLNSYSKSLPTQSSYLGHTDDETVRIDYSGDSDKATIKVDENDVPSLSYKYIPNTNVPIRPGIEKHIHSNKLISDNQDRIYQFHQINKLINDKSDISNQTEKLSHHRVDKIIELQENTFLEKQQINNGQNIVGFIENELKTNIPPPNGLIRKISEAINQNVEDFRKIFYSYFSKNPKGRENLQDLEKLYLILTIFTQLNIAKRLGLPIEQYIDQIIKIVQPDIHSLGPILEINENSGAHNSNTVCINCNGDKIKNLSNSSINTDNLLSDKPVISKIPSNSNTKNVLHTEDKSQNPLDVKYASTENIPIKEPEHLIESVIPVSGTIYSEAKMVKPVPELNNIEAKTIKPLADSNNTEVKTIKPMLDLNNVEVTAIKPTSDLSNIDVNTIKPMLELDMNNYYGYKKTPIVPQSYNFYDPYKFIDDREKPSISANPDEEIESNIPYLVDISTNDSLEFVAYIIIGYLRNVFRDLGLDILITNVNFDLTVKYLMNILLMLVNTLTAHGVTLKVVMKVLMDMQHKFHSLQSLLLQKSVQNVYPAVVYIIKSVIASVMENISK